jgi:hypothetical protein
MPLGIVFQWRFELQQCHNSTISQELLTCFAVSLVPRTKLNDMSSTTKVI